MIQRAHEIVTLHGDGISDDTAYFQAAAEDRIIRRADGGEADSKPGDYVARLRDQSYFENCDLSGTTAVGVYEIK